MSLPSKIRPKMRYSTIGPGNMHLLYTYQEVTKSCLLGGNGHIQDKTSSHELESYMERKSRKSETDKTEGITYLAEHKI